MWSPARRPVPVSSDAERTLPDARRYVPWRSEGKSQRLEARELLGRVYRSAEARPATTNGRERLPGEYLARHRLPESRVNC